MNNLRARHIRRSPQGGYIALVSALIISALLGVLALTESTSIFWTRFSELDTMHKEQSDALASSCAYEAAFAYAENPPLAAPALLSTGSGMTCTLEKVTALSGTVTLYVLATVASIPTLLAVQLSAPSPSGAMSAISWNEVTSVPP